MAECHKTLWLHKGAEMGVDTLENGVRKGSVTVPALSEFPNTQDCPRPSWLPMNCSAAASSQPCCPNIQGAAKFHFPAPLKSSFPSLLLAGLIR